MSRFRSEIEQMHSNNELADWLLRGVDAMCRVSSDATPPFHPLEDLIGHNDQSTWVDDLVELASSIVGKPGLAIKNAAMVAAMQAVKRGLTVRNYVSLIYLFELVRRLECNCVADLASTTLPQVGASDLDPPRKGRLLWTAMEAVMRAKTNLSSGDLKVAEQLRDGAQQFLPQQRNEINANYNDWQPASYADISMMNKIFPGHSKHQESQRRPGAQVVQKHEYATTD